jgi:hypothetical protein
MLPFLSLLLENALKGNEHLQTGLLTGMIPLSMGSTFSGLNNVVSYSVLRKKYNDCFGFTQDEVNKILEDYQLTDQESSVKDWYNGYYFGDKEIYNPWSILHFVDSKGEFRPYWLSTSANDLVQKLIKDSDNKVKQDIENILNGKFVRSNIVDNISFPGLQASRENILSFLVQTGYLKARYKEMQDNRMLYEVSLPNDELKLIYADTIKYWFDESIGSANLHEMLKALISGDIDLFGEILSNFVVAYLSYYHTSQDHIEKVYHAFVLGMLIQLQGTYRIESEREAGYGRVDVLMTPEDKTQPGIVMELKKIRVSENKDSALAAALAQIEDRQYETLLRQQGCQHIMKLAVTFDGKGVWVKRG